MGDRRIAGRSKRPARRRLTPTTGAALSAVPRSVLIVIVMWRVDYFRGCCEFSTFVDGFLAAARRHDVPLACINSLQARRDWRSGMTGYEALMMQRRELLKEGEYLFVQAT